MKFLKTTPRTYLQSQQQQECLHRVVSSVDEVTHEQIIRLGNVAADFEELFEIVELSMNITANLNSHRKQKKCESR